MNVVETFAGIGGLHCRFYKAGFKLLILNDIKQSAIDSIKANFLQYDPNIVNVVRSNRLMLIIYLPTVPIDVLSGGISCKGISVFGPRNVLT